MIYLIIILALFLVLLAVVGYFFSVAFVKHNVGNTDDMNDPINKPLQKYRKRIEEGISYISNTPHTDCFTTSFDGLKLYARYYDNKSEKTIILFHGYRSSAARDFSCALEMYTQLGLNVLLCDQRAHGKSEGKLITFGVKERKDVLSWINYITEKYKAKYIILDGLSMGATTVLSALELNLPESVKGVIADCGFTSPKAIIKKVGLQFFKINATPLLPFLNIFCLLIGKFSLYSVNTVRAVENSELPILLIHGENDGFVPCDMSIENFSVANENSKLVTVSEADHGLSFLVDEQLVRSEVKNFLEKVFN